MTGATDEQELTPEGKEALRKTIRGLRERLHTQLREEADRQYQLGVGAAKAKLPEARAKRRERLEAWLSEHARTATQGGKAPTAKQKLELRERHLADALQEAAYTLVNRLVFLRMLEAAGLSKPLVLTGGWKSPGYEQYRDFARSLCSDERDGTKGYAALLQLLFDELSLELPGVFGPVGLTELFPIPAATLREVVEALDDDALNSAWLDDTTPGWVYQFWNDPQREALDEKVKNRGKIEPHELASKTQLFTERYMVEWLLHNSLGQTWLAMCQKNGWTADFLHENGGTSCKDALDARRADWRAKREAGEVEADALMPLHSELEQRWKYWVPQPMPDDAPAAAPETLRELKLLDPACGSGHFLVIAFDWLAAAYEEEARHRGEDWSAEDIARWVVEHNLHGIDIDPRAVQIAAAALWLKAKRYAPHVRLQRINLVAPRFQLGALSDDDPALKQLLTELETEVGLEPAATLKLIRALEGVDHLGTLLRIDDNVRKALPPPKGMPTEKGVTGDIFERRRAELLTSSPDRVVNEVLERVGVFLSRHQRSEDLGLRLEGEQLAAGVRYLQVAREGTYHVVVGNPPYMGVGKLAEVSYYVENYPAGRQDLLAGFFLRGVELCQPGGSCGLLTLSNWLFLGSYQEFREAVSCNHLSTLADLGKSAFTTGGTLISTCGAIFRVGSPGQSVAIRPHAPDEVVRDAGQPFRTQAALLGQRGRYEFDVAKLAGIEGTPLVYWWGDDFLGEYIQATKLGAVAEVCSGINSGNNDRFVRLALEVGFSSSNSSIESGSPDSDQRTWVPYVKGGRGRAWIEPLRNCLYWPMNGLPIRAFAETGSGANLRNVDRFFQIGVAFTPTGSSFRSRVHRFPSICDMKGASVYGHAPWAALCTLNRTISTKVATSLNPTVSFQVGDIRRIPWHEDEHAVEVAQTISRAFSIHESQRETSIEFRRPVSTPWAYAEDWAQRAVDRPKGAPLPPYEEELDPPDPTSFVSFAIGVALGRFGENGEGIIDPSLTPAPSNKPYPPVPSDPNDPTSPPDVTPVPLPPDQEILDNGILFLAAHPSLSDGLDHPAAKRIDAAWKEHKAGITEKKTTLHEWLRKDFFPYHKGLYENRPIYFPLSSKKKSFVAFISIHRWKDDTLQTLLARHLHPARETLAGELKDLDEARASSDKKERDRAEKTYAKSKTLFDELEEFIDAVTACAEKGAPPVDARSPGRAADASFRMDLDDGVMINSAALWPLLLPQWKDPKKWWKELCEAKGRKDYDWSHLAARYFPDRVDAKCQEDPSLAVAHGCFWKYHPAKAYAWELRLQDEIGPDFTIDEAGSDDAREAFLKQHPTEVEEIEAKERTRRERKQRKADKEAS